jgi:hypothetical protein
MNFILTHTIKGIVNGNETYFPAARTAIEAAYQTRVMDRVWRMEEEGYRAKQMGKTLWFAIFRPGSTETRAEWKDYLVDLTPGKENCTCASFTKGSCKHIEWVLMLLHRQKHEEELCEQAEVWEEERAFVEGLLIERTLPGIQHGAAVNAARQAGTPTPRATAYQFEKGWIDCTGRTRTWFVMDSDGKRLAEVTTKRAATRLVEMLPREPI